MPAWGKAAEAPLVILATGEQALFEPGNRATVDTGRPVGHYRLPTNLRAAVN